MSWASAPLLGTMITQGLAPAAASTNAARVDRIFFAMFAAFVVFLIVLGLFILTFAIRYRARSGADRSDKTAKSWRREITWIVIPAIIAFGIFLWAGTEFYAMTTPPKDCLTMYVVGKQWMWKVQHPSGAEEINMLHVPVGRPVRLVLRSQDVIHSFFVPAFRIKQDALPNRYTSLWFEANRVGMYHLLCAEYCGTDHARMRGTVVVMPAADYAKWASAVSPVPKAEGLPGTDAAPLALRGQGVFYRLGCSACHTPYDAVRAPRLDGIFGEQVRLNNAAHVVADEQYIRESILEPNAKISAGYPAPSLMPPYQGQLSEQELGELVEFIRSLRNGWPEWKEPQP